jgi:hypothetical protein
MPQLTNLVKTILCKNSVVAGATDITDATVVDTAGYDGVRFIFGFGTITSGAATSTGVAGKATNSPTPAPTISPARRSPSPTRPITRS